MIEIYGDGQSGNCWKVRQILDFTARPYRWQEVNVLARETRTPAFLALNPNGKVPIVRLDDGTVLTESGAILCHFAEGTPWLPERGLPRTRVLEWLFFEQYSHEPNVAVARYWIHYLNAKDEYADRLPARWEGGYKALDVMERRLGEHEWLTDAGPTVADVALYAYTHVAGEGGFTLEGYPGVRAWLGRFAGLQHYGGLK
ncbi:MAG: glutathione S-transferase family protein [Geminicoccaceae bacterium]|nr:glutathione S-transferase family protein [Geminicoccaceae bacterium]